MVGEGLIAGAVTDVMLRRVRMGQTLGRVWNDQDWRHVHACAYFHWRTGTIVKFTRDMGADVCGWLKPRYVRCRHLTLSFRQPYPERDAGEWASLPHLGRAAREKGWGLAVAPFDPVLADMWVKRLFGSERQWVWEGPPETEEEDRLGVRHYRLFCGAEWRMVRVGDEADMATLARLRWRRWSDVSDRIAA